MEKKINPLLKIFPLVILVGLLFSSCIDEWLDDSDDDNYSAVSFGFVQTNSADNTFTINLDNGSRITPVQNSVSEFGVSDSDRVMVNFDASNRTPLTDSTVNYHSKIYNLRKILYKDIKKLSEVDDDSIGNDPIIVREAWISGNHILNLDLRFYTQGSFHYINLLNNEAGNGGSANPYVLELRHNARGDVASYLVSGIVSFDLNSLKVPGQNEIKFFIRYTDYRGNNIEIPKTFRY